MILCPNCSNERFKPSDKNCSECGWNRIFEDGVVNYFTDSDRISQISEKYVNTYESLAVTNLEQSNIDRRFLKNQASNMVNYISPLTGLDICDLGIGQGFLCDQLVEAGVKSVAAVDVSKSYLNRFVGHNVVTPYLANAENLPFKNHFDVLVSTDVMEHVINVGSFLFCINRALKKEGVVAIRVPYKEGMVNYSPHMGYNHVFGHLRSFNKELLKIYLEQAGFIIKAFHLDGFSIGTPQPYLYSTVKRKNIYHKFAKYLNARLDHPADATLLNSQFAKLFMKPVEIVVVAQKTRDLGYGD